MTEPSDEARNAAVVRMKMLAGCPDTVCAVSVGEALTAAYDIDAPRIRAEERERLAKLQDERHREFFVPKGRNPEDYTSESSLFAAWLRSQRKDDSDD